MKLPIIVALIATGALALTPSVQAQFGGRSAMAQAFEPDVWERDLPIFAEVLQLEEWQRPIVDTLVADYLASFQAGIETMRTRMQRAGEDADKGNIGAVLKPIDDWNNDKKKLYTKFLDMVRTQLSAQQLERWPKLERAMRRERLLPQSELSGEGINLFGLMRDLSPPPEVTAAAELAIEAYEARIDAALAIRQARMEEMLPEVIQAMTEMDQERGLQLQERIMSARVQLRDAQEQSIREIAEAMGPDWGEKFRVIAMQRSYPEVYAPDPVMRQYEAALALTDLTEQQRTSITNLQGEFVRELGLLADRLLAAIKSDEPNTSRRRMASGKSTVASTPAQRLAEQGEIEAIRREKRHTSEKFRELLEAQLSTDQLAQLPGAGKGVGQAAEGGKSAGAVKPEQMRPADASAVGGAARAMPAGRKSGVGANPTEPQSPARDAPARTLD